MHATAGDWLIVEQSTVDRPARRGRIVEVRDPDGAPPYVVHWLDSEHETLVYPGPDAHVLTAVELAESDVRMAERVVVVQRAIASRDDRTG